MKAIYINIDPYLAAFAAWLKGGKSGAPPTFNPLPLSVTIPLGESAAIYLEKAWVAEDEDYGLDILTIDGVSVGVNVGMTGEGDALARDVVPGLSALAPAAKYAVVPVTGDASVQVYINDGESDVGTIPFTVLVRRETASGPVDLVDFTPPAAAPTLTAAAINTALGGTGAEEGDPLNGVPLVGASFSGASLAGADFTGADFTGADFTGASFSGASLAGADISDTTWSGSSISAVSPDSATWVLGSDTASD